MRNRDKLGHSLLKKKFVEDKTLEIDNNRTLCVYFVDETKITKLRA